jgi:hypothetical protein
MTETPTFRRHPDGSIDFDFYRERAATLRRQAMRDLATQRIAPAGSMVMAGALGFAVVLPTTTSAIRDQMVAAQAD